jgi:phosphoglycolate phosphatase
MKYKLVIFDLDGTLVDAYQAVSKSLNYTLTSFDLSPIDDETIKRSVGWGDRNLISRFVPANTLEKALKIYRRHHAKTLHQGVSFLPHAKRVLEALDKNGYKLAVASNRPTKFTKIILKELNALIYFDKVLCADKVKRGKPAPDILLNIMKTLRCKPQETLYVGDMMIDAEAGTRAGIKTVAVLTGSCKRKDITPYKPYKIIKSIKDIPLN